MTHTHTRTVFSRGTIPSISIALPEPSRLTFGIVWLLLLALAVSYGYFVNQTVVNIVARTSAETAIEDVRSSIGNLESEYIATKNAITLEFAHARGFSETEMTESSYVSRIDSDTLLTYHETRY